VVYGDIGTSPLYALRECFRPEHGVLPTPQNVIGVLSLIVWSLITIISIKYLALVMRADNRGEGGILALMALVDARGEKGRQRIVLVALGLFGAALLWRRLSRRRSRSRHRGPRVATPMFSPFVVDHGVVLVILFLVQRFGTGWVGALFGPVMLVWFVVIAILGVVTSSGAARSGGLQSSACRPVFTDNHKHGFLCWRRLSRRDRRSAVCRHGTFRRPSIRRAWFTIVFPAALSYLGGALSCSTAREARSIRSSPRAEMGAVSTRRTRDDRDGHRVAGGPARTR
jgi:KUP system potassium uptake protein